MVDDDERPRAELSFDRRALCRTSATLIAGAAITACGNRDDPEGSASKHHHNTGGTKMTNTETAVELIELTFGDLEARQAAGTDNANALVTKYKQRITALNEAGPKLRAVIAVNPDADSIAGALDAERAAGKHRGVLHGLPILLKDNIDTGDKQPTTAGSLALAGSHATKDAFVVKKLRDAGAVILGKTNLSEWANFRGKLSSSGWSGVGGQCRNPYALDRSPAGSSSGSAVATAASLCAAAIGSETDGSIVSPSSLCGLVGIKPTVGLVSRAGVIPLSSSQDTLGPIARTVTDAAILLTVIAGADPDDPATTVPDKRRPAQPIDYTKALDRAALKDVRLGVPRKSFFGIHRAVDKMMGLTLADLRNAGVVLVDVQLDMPPELSGAQLLVLTAEMKVGLDKYLAARGADTKVHSINNVIEFNRQNHFQELANYGQEFFEQADQRTGGLAANDYVAARATCLKHSRDQLDALMAANKLDGFVAPTRAPAWLIDPVNGDNTTSISASTLPALAGYPHITVPGAGYHGLPLGVSFFAGAYSEAKLISYAYAYEQLTKHRRPPQYLATFDPKGQ
jgi:amidase